MYGCHHQSPQRPMIKAIFAVDINGGLGLSGRMPWPSCKEDFAWFKKTTQGQVVVMGRSTWNAPDMPKPLPGRVNVVITNGPIDGVITRSGNVIEILQHTQDQYPDKDVYVIGGASIIQQAEPAINIAYVTTVPGSYNCDVRLDMDKFLKRFRCQGVNYLNDSVFVRTYARVSKISEAHSE